MGDCCTDKEAKEGAYCTENEANALLHNEAKVCDYCIDNKANVRA